MSELFDLDEVSLQCFTNKHVYKKYLAKKYPLSNTLPSANTQTQQKAAIRADALVNLFTQLLHNTCHDKYDLLDSKFFPFIEACIDYLEKHERRELANENISLSVDLPTVTEDISKNLPV